MKTKSKFPIACFAFGASSSCCDAFISKTIQHKHNNYKNPSSRGDATATTLVLSAGFGSSSSNTSTSKGKKKKNKSKVAKNNRIKPCNANKIESEKFNTDQDKYLQLFHELKEDCLTRHVTAKSSIDECSIDGRSKVELDLSYSS